MQHSIRNNIFEDSITNSQDGKIHRILAVAFNSSKNILTDHPNANPPIFNTYPEIILTKSYAL